MSKLDKLFIEQHQRGWAVKQENAERASAVKGTQAEAIARAEEINPNAELHIQGLNGKWRKKMPYDPE
jgi:uncharacterized protein YdaT